MTDQLGLKEGRSFPLQEFRYKKNKKILNAFQLNFFKHVIIKLEVKFVDLFSFNVDIEGIRLFHNRKFLQGNNS